MPKRRFLRHQTPLSSNAQGLNHTPSNSVESNQMSSPNSLSLTKWTPKASNPLVPKPVESSGAEPRRGVLERRTPKASNPQASNPQVSNKPVSYFWHRIQMPRITGCEIPRHQIHSIESSGSTCQASNDPVVEIGISSGIAVPFKNNAGAFRWTLELGRRGDVQSHGAREMFIKQTFSIAGLVM